MINFSIATSWDNELLSRLNELNKRHKDRQISKVYGSLRTSIVGSARPAYRLPDVSWRKMIDHIECAHEYGFEFDYVMNALDFRGKEKSKQWVDELIEFIAKLDEEAKVNCLTITHPFLIKLVKKEFPRFKINLSLIAGVDTVEQAKEYEDMGVDVIHLNPFTINRDFQRLEQIVKAVDIPVVLYANIPCLDDCPWWKEHYEFFGYASQRGDESAEAKFDPFIVKCSSSYLDNPIRIIASPFIRPEDIEEYEKLGISNFKLSARDETSSFLLKTAKAYLQGEYHGDLFKLIFRSGSKFTVGVKHRCPEIANIRIPIKIYNDALTGMDFIRHIRGGCTWQFYVEAASRCMAVEPTDRLNKLKEYLRLIFYERKDL